MLRHEIIDGSENVRKALKAAGFPGALIVRPDGQPESKFKTAMTAYTHFYAIAKDFGEVERKILSIFELSTMLEPAKFSDALYSLMTRDEKSELFIFRRNLANLMQFLPQFETLLLQSTTGHPVKATADEQAGSASLLTIILPEPKHTHSKPARIVDAIEAVTAFYEVAAAIEKSDPSDLALVRCDSGSDKSFDFLGAAKLVEQVRLVILEIWSGIIFFRQNRSMKEITVIAESLPVIERIAKMRESGALSPEEAAHFRRRLIEGTGKFIDAGIITPEIRNNSTFDANSLLGPSPKLLAGPDTVRGDNKAELLGKTSEDEVDEESLQ